MILNGMLLTCKVTPTVISKRGSHYVKGLSFETPVPTGNGKI